MGQSDICLKRYLSDEERFADLINGILGEGEHLLSPEDLTDMDSQVGYHNQRHQGYRDLLKKAAFGMNFMVIGIENQERTNYLMPLRCLCYDASEYERQAAVEKSRMRRWKKMKAKISKEEFLSDFQKEKKLHPCITLVLYFGEKWDGASRLHELLDLSGIPERFKRYVNDYPMYLVHVRRLQDTSVFQTDLKMVFDCIRFSNDKERLYRTIQENEGYNQLDEDAYDVIARYTRIFGDKKIDVLEWGKVNMCKAMQELREDWKEEGRAEGKAEGKAEGMREGKAKGKAEGRQDMVLELLNEIGTLSERLERRIRQECNLQVLCAWAKLAMRSETIREFEQAMESA